MKKGDSNVALGQGAGGNLIIGNNNIYIGTSASSASENGLTRIGRKGINVTTFIAGIYQAPVNANNNPLPVYIDSFGQLGSLSSSERFKKDIHPMDRSSDVLLQLDPVTFHYKSDDTATPEFGLIAEQVEKVDPDLVVRGDDGKVYSVRYDAVNAMLLNEFLKEHRKVEEQGVMIAKQQKQIEALTVGLQKVSAQVELNKPSPQMAVTNQ